MRHILSKCSSPGWREIFDFEYDARQKLLKYICDDCLYEWHEGISFKTVLQEDIQDLLGTTCGLEFNYFDDACAYMEELELKHLGYSRKEGFIDNVPNWEEPLPEMSSARG